MIEQHYLYANLVRVLIDIRTAYTFNNNNNNKNNNNTNVLRKQHVTYYVRGRICIEKKISVT